MTFLTLYDSISVSLFHSICLVSGIIQHTALPTSELSFWTLLDSVRSLIPLSTSHFSNHQAYVPSKLQLITLDTTIILLQIILVTIAYETSLSVNSSEPDFLTSLPPLELPSHSPSSSRMGAKEMDSSHYIIDLQFKQILSRLRHPPTIRPPNTNTSGRFSNLAPWPLHSGVGMALLRAGRRARTGGNSRSTGDRRVPENPDTANQTEA